ncbi:hydroxymethylglutaryl-CoA lyase [Polymorphobacter multimanifer]|uniref:hydroxymethylglutaryl-CoA lyase n=1 Tax=Polymorphobacter multimanifer TaxID=1070431 RepID=UPI0016649713|nr:hydroxymethylglutaryl-CoA lyase [Polymorphobacter multimanifer]GGI84148.1 hydroxymethylglutaryl-CoA lyase [Polymorphobacter multimanifer]
MPAILVSEVGPRDGLQSIDPILPLSVKTAWIDALVAAGVREIEVGSFVPAKLLPQLADTAAVVAHALKHSGLTVAVLVPNARGAEAALAAGAHNLTLPLSALETHRLTNLRRTHAQVLEDAAAIATLCKSAAYDVHFEGSVSTAFGCTLEGVVTERKVVELAEALMAAGVDEVGLSDTTGYANPAQVKSVVRAVHAAIGTQHLTGLHLHNTRGLGLANVLAGLDVGITTFDASLAGLGGCPFAPGASGNIVTEDLVFMLEAMGLDTGIDLPRLLDVRKILAAALPDEPLYGFTPDAGLPLGFAVARG